MSDTAFNLIIIGSGPAGTAALEAAHDAGVERIAIIEAGERLGGECPNWGCVPTKALLRSAEVLETVRHAAEFGVKVKDIEFDLEAVMERKQAIVDSMTSGGRLERYIEDQLKATLVRGEARFTGKDAVTVDGKVYTGEKFIVATGSRVWVPPIDGLSEVEYWTSDDVIALKSIPASVVIVGGGPIGVESAQILSSFGAKVTIVEFAPHILPSEDEEIAKVVTDAFSARGITCLTGAAAQSVQKTKDGYTVVVTTDEGSDKTELHAEAFMVATGKRPAIDGLDPEIAGIEIDHRGRPALDAHLRSTNKNVYFAGDAAGMMLFTHVAHEQGVMAAENALKGDIRKVDLRVVPRGTFCTPEVGSVGITEKAARDDGQDVVVGRFLFGHVGKASVSGYREGMVKIVADRKTKEILGGHVVGHSASELVHEIALAMQARIPYTVIAEMIHAYPTFAEAIGAAAYDVGTQEK